MRVIENSGLLGMESPIRWTFTDLHKAIVNIAPEKLNHFEKEHSEFILEYLDCSDWVCRVYIAKKHIQISRSVLEVLWCVSYAHIVIYQKKVEGKKFEESTEINLTSDKEVAEGLKLMTWALNNLFFPTYKNHGPMICHVQPKTLRRSLGSISLTNFACAQQRL